jgi:predicted nucleotidyltransferase
MMRTPSPELLPLFRSRGQGRLLARVYLEPDRPAPLAQLARELRLDGGGITREANRLERAGLVRSERVGRSRVLHPNEDSPYYPELSGLLLKAFGPATVIGPALARVDGIEHAYLFGSWAARYQGEPGPPPADIDLLLIGTPEWGAVARVARELTSLLGREVNPTILSPDQWRDDEDGFVRQVTREPRIELELGRQ